MNNRKLKNRAGLTIIELMVAMVSASLVVLATGSILIFGQRSLNRQWQHVNLQREVSNTMLEIKHTIRGANKALLEADGLTVRIYNSAGWTRYMFSPETKSLLYQKQDQEEQTLLLGLVESASFVIDPTTNSTVTVTIKLQQGEYQAQATSTINMRNYGT
jgi:type II secretory pathway component PulJ